MPNPISCEVTGSYLFLFKPVLRKTAKPGDAPKFKGLFFIAPETMETAAYKEMTANVITCAREKWGDKADAMLRDGVIDLPIKRDIETQGFPPQFARYFNAESGEDHPPLILDRRAKPITDKREIYSGIRMEISYNLYAYGGPGTEMKPGIRFGLRNVRKLGDGPKLNPNDGGGDEFKPLEGGDAAGDPASDEDMASLM